jgi:hypothetical protein
MALFFRSHQVRSLSHRLAQGLARRTCPAFPEPEALGSPALQGRDWFYGLVAYFSLKKNNDLNVRA